MGKPAPSDPRAAAPGLGLARESGLKEGPAGRQERAENMTNSRIKISATYLGDIFASIAHGKYLNICNYLIKLMLPKN